MNNPGSRPVRDSVDAIVVGGGIVGTAATWNLSRRGLSVLLLEKGRIGAEQSSRNWGSVRAQRRPPEELPLMLESIRIWQSLEKSLETDLDWKQCGHMRLCYDRKWLQWAEEWVPTGRDHGLDTQVLTPDECKSLLPNYSGDGLLGALYTSTDGCAEPEKVSAAYARAASRNSARIAEHCAVLGIESQNGRVSGVVTESGPVRADVVICASGAWTSRLLRPIGIRHPSLWVRGTAARTAPIGIRMRPLVTWGRCACRQRPDGSLTLAAAEDGYHDIMLDSLRYGISFLPLAWRNRELLRMAVGRPLLDDIGGAFRGFEASRTLDPEPDARGLDRAISAYAREYPSAAPLNVIRSWAGWIDYMPDELPVLGEAPGISGLFIAAGFSGNGFGMGPVAGKILSDLVCRGTSEHDLSGFSPDRFRRFRTRP